MAFVAVARGYEVLYAHAESGPFAERIAGALKTLLPAHGEGLVYRNGLYLLRYRPSVLVELGFIDSPADMALLTDAEWRERACRVIAEDLAEFLEETGHGGTEAQSAEAQSHG